MKKNDHLDILSAIWILSCNDENSIITYEGIKDRLAIVPPINIQELINSHRELFRPGANETGFNEWKAEMQAGRRLPSWLKNKSDEERIRTINSLTMNDVFRNQFRATGTAGPTELSILNWGLDYIERKRKFGLDKNQEFWKLLTTGVLPILTILLSAFTIFLTYKNIETQKKLKFIELEYNKKQEGYSRFMQSVVNSYTLSINHADKSEILKELDKMEFTYYNIEPLVKEVDRNRIWTKYQLFQHFCLTDKTENIINLSDSCLIYKNGFRQILYNSLFENIKE